MHEFPEQSDKRRSTSKKTENRKNRKWIKALYLLYEPNVQSKTLKKEALNKF
jgi:hypothetical protein